MTPSTGRAWRTACLAHATAAFEAAPPMPHIVRPEPVGELVASWVLPLDLLRPTNRTRGAAGWAQGAVKRRLAAEMAAQRGPRREPLQGRPQVLCVRFSSVEPDAYNDGFKAAVDILCAPLPALTREGKLRKRRCTGRLNFIRGDRPRDIELRQWWEPAPPKRGFGLIQIWTGTA